MRTESKKPILGVVALLSLLVMAASAYADYSGVAVISGFVLFVSIVIALNRFIADVEYGIIHSDD